VLSPGPFGAEQDDTYAHRAPFARQISSDIASRVRELPARKVLSILQKADVSVSRVEQPLL